MGIGSILYCSGNYNIFCIYLSTRWPPTTGRTTLGQEYQLYSELNSLAVRFRVAISCDGFTIAKNLEIS
jgi:hypothetical protein